MDKNEIANSFALISSQLTSSSEELVNYLQPTVGAIFNRAPNKFGRMVYMLDHLENKDKRAWLEIHSTGLVVFDLQERLTPEEQTSLDTSNNFLEPDLRLITVKMIDIKIPDGIERLNKTLKNHFNE